MAHYVDEEDVWKCPKHPSKRRRTGICHVCLRERLSCLCPECANVRPCGCIAATTSTSGSSSSTFSRFSFSAATESSAAGIGATDSVSKLIDSEPSFRRSRSLAVPFLRSKPPVGHDYSIHKDSTKTASSPSTFWSLFKTSSSNKSKRVDAGNGVVSHEDSTKHDLEEERKRMMRKSRSVAVTSNHGVADVRSSKSRGWHFPSPIKAFKQSISRGIMVQERSPLYRG